MKLRQGRNSCPITESSKYPNGPGLLLVRSWVGPLTGMPQSISISNRFVHLPGNRLSTFIYSILKNEFGLFNVHTILYLWKLFGAH